MESKKKKISMSGLKLKRKFSAIVDGNHARDEEDSDSDEVMSDAGDGPPMPVPGMVPLFARHQSLIVDQSAYEPPRSSSSTEIAQPTTNEDLPKGHCNHVRVCRERECVKTIHMPDQWICRTCETSDSIRLCLRCGICYCKTHAKDHYLQDKQHAVILQINTEDKVAYCFDCSCIVSNDTRSRTLEKLRRVIDEVQTLSLTQFVDDIAATPDGEHDKHSEEAPHSPPRKAARLSVETSSVIRSSPVATLSPRPIPSQQATSSLSTLPKIQTSTPMEVTVDRKVKVHVDNVGMREIFLPYLTPAAVQARASEDLAKTAGIHWIDGLLTRVFRAWKGYKREQTPATTITPSASPTPVSVLPTRSFAEKRVVPAFVPGRCGLRNLGNTCYMNSVLQAFSNLLTLREYYRVQFTKDTTTIATHDPEMTELSGHFVTLMKMLWSGKRVQFTPDDLLKTIWAKHTRFKGFKQQDAQELVIFLLHQLSDEQQKGLNRANYEPNHSAKKQQEEEEVKGNKKRKKSTRRKNSRNSGTTSPTEMNKQESNGVDFISRNFSGQVRDQVACHECSYVSHRETATSVISLQFPPESFKSTKIQAGLDTLDMDPRNEKAPTWMKKYAFDISPEEAKKLVPTSRRRVSRAKRAFFLEECLEFVFCSTEELNGENKYKCDQCNKKVDATKSHVISALPSKYLILHLERTEFNLRTLRSTKNTSVVNFPLEKLDMRPYFQEKLGQTTEGNDPDDTSYLYDLDAVVSHHGRGMTEGHFTNFSWSPTQASWFLFNDMKVNTVSAHEVRNAEAYLLFYSRRDK